MSTESAQVKNAQLTSRAEASARSFAAIERRRSISSSALSASVAMLSGGRGENVLLRVVVVVAAALLDRAVGPFIANVVAVDVDGTTNAFVVVVARPTTIARDKALALSCMVFVMKYL